MYRKIKNNFILHLSHFCPILGENVKNVLKTDASEDLFNTYTKEGITADGKLLVLFIFNSKEEMRLIRMHPEMIQVDTTHGTNHEKKSYSP